MDKGVCKDTHRNDQTALNISDLSVYYGEAKALDSVSIAVRPKEIVAVLGSNGAGKSTLIKTITGLHKAGNGQITYKDSPIHDLSPNEIIRKGISCVPEGRQLFGPMSVSDNLYLGSYSVNRRQQRQALNERFDKIVSLFPILKTRLNQRANTMSGGEQQMLALGRALMSMPSLLVLDEPSLGISPLLVSEMMKVLKEICESLNVSILLIEQNARAALKIADYVYVLERGQVVIEGACQDVIDSPAIQSAYLGA